MLFIAFYIAAQIKMIWCKLHIHLKKITNKPYSIIIVFIILYNYSGMFISAV